MLLPLAVVLLRATVLAPFIGTSVWYPFFPALFISSWIGTRRSAVVATSLTAGAAWWALIPPYYTWGAQHWEDVFGALVLFASGILFAFFHDRLRRTDARLRTTLDATEIFRALLENSSDFIGIADPDGTPVYVNPAGRRMVGMPDEYPVDATTIPEYYPPDQRAFAQDVIVKEMIEHDHWSGETHFRNWRTQEAIPVWDTHFMIRHADTGRVVGMGTITRDITELKRARDDIARANGQLTQANEEITALNAQLTRVDELKTRFFANVSHELRTPLTLILGSIEKRLADASLDEDLRRDLEVADRNARTVLRHVNDLLDVAKLDAGRLKAEYAETDAALLVRIVADHFSALANENHVTFIVDAPAGLQVQTDPGKLQRMLLNLLSNAFKFTPAGGEIRVTLHDRRPSFRIEVADSGPGIPPDKRAAIFERFEQLEDRSVRSRSGTGLGLSIVREFAALLGGTVSVDDAPEGGALFAIELPSAAPAAAAVHPSAREEVNARDMEQIADELRRAAPRVGAIAATGQPHEGRILVVEDSRDMSQFIVDSLRLDGFEVLCAYDGREGYERAVAERPDLVLTDVMMPNMSGDQLVHQLREKPYFESTPIVVLTARSDEELRVRLLREGVQDYLDKPFSVAELRARVRNLIARKRAEEHLKTLQQQLETLAKASQSISDAVTNLPEQSVKTVLQTIALNARAIVGADLAAAGIGGDKSHPFDTWAFVGLSAEEAALIGHAPRPIGLLSGSSRTVRLRDVHDHPAHRGFPPHHPVITSFMGAPIRHRGKIVGHLFLGNKRGAAEFTEQDQQWVEALAVRAGGAVETARLYAAEGRTRAWLQTVVDQMPEAIMLMDADGKVTIENQRLRTLEPGASPATDRFGNAVRFALRLPSGEPVAPDDLPIVKAVTARETIVAREFVGRRAGHDLPLLGSAAPIIAGDGTLAGAVMVLKDISALKELERLRQEWASIVAHDLRQPIGAIALKSSVLAREALTDAQRRDVAQISASTQRLSSMVSDLMDVSLLDSSRIQLARSRLDLGQLVRDVVERIPLAAPRTIVRTPADARLFIDGDAERLEQVITNLVSNAVKYGAPDTEIVVEVRRADGDAELLVTNHGPGIPPDELPLIFERYVRSRDVQRGATKGLGLGLYITRGLVEAHGGRIWADSVPGELTTFHVRLPLDGAPVPIDAPVRALQSEPS